MDIHEEWKAGVQSEIDFWHEVFVGDKFPEYKREMMGRIKSSTPVSPYIAAHLPTHIPTADVKILDVAAGPISCVGWSINGECPQITPIDALATHYLAILEEFKLVPPVYTQQCDGEKIHTLFPPNSFDVVHIRNALDHCYDALMVMRNMLSVLKPGGVLIVCGYTDEAMFGNYDGLHQWNIRVDDGQMIIWRPGERHEINKLFADQLRSVDAIQDDTCRWTSVKLKKR